MSESVLDQQAASGPSDALPAPHRRILESSRLLRGLTPAQLGRVAALWEERVYAPGEYLLREGEPDGFVYVLVEGRALLVKGSALGREPSPIGELQVGDTFGELKIVDPRPSTAMPTPMKTHGIRAAPQSTRKRVSAATYHRTRPKP